MPIKFEPIFTITPKIASLLVAIEASQQDAKHLPLTAAVLASLRESARLMSTHYSTMIEGNRLTVEQATEVIKHQGHFPGRERDEAEVQGYYQALAYVEAVVARGELITEKIIQTLHALALAGGLVRVTLTPYRDGQNVIRDGASGAIVYLPPEAKDVPALMQALVAWVHEHHKLPVPIVAAIVHYQIATIHPYYDGNGRTARLLTTLVLHLSGYDVRGVYSLEEYYARNLPAYYQALSVGPSHNYYLGRVQANITEWIEYFVEGMAASLANIVRHMREVASQAGPDMTVQMRSLDPKQRKVLELFSAADVVTAKQIGALFLFQPRTSSQLCRQWVEAGFLEVVNPSNKARSYRLADAYRDLVA